MELINLDIVVQKTHSYHSSFLYSRRGSSKLEIKSNLHCCVL